MSVYLLASFCCNRSPDEEIVKMQLEGRSVCQGRTQSDTLKFGIRTKTSRLKISHLQTVLEAFQFLHLTAGRSTQHTTCSNGFVCLSVASL